MGDLLSIEILQIQEDVLDGARLGRHVEHDERSRGFAHLEAPEKELVSVLWPRRSPIFDQGGIGACTGNAIAGAVGTDRMAGSGREDMNEEWAVRLYTDATQLDDIPGGMPDSDTGSSGLAACKAAKNAGLIDGYRHAFSFNAVLTALLRGPAIVGMTWLSDCDSPDGNGDIDYSGTIRGGHEVLLRGCDLVTRYLWLDNSWGEGWGLGGSFRMSFAAFKIAMAMNGDVTVPVFS
jgi:hypothetical protein